MATAESRDGHEQAELPAPEPERDVVEQLRRLKALHRHGALSDAELLAAQNKLLSRE